MDQKGIEAILNTLKAYSAAAEEVAYNLQKYDYRNEALEWDRDRQPGIMESVHPTLCDLYSRLARFIATLTYRDDNLERNQLLNETNFKAVTNYLEVSQDKLSGTQFNCINIEPMLDVAKEFKNLNLLTEARLLNNIYQFAYGIRQWNQKSRFNPGTPIRINIELNYDEATQADLEKDNGFRIFASLFKSSCNYATAQKRALYNELKQLYSTIDPKAADRTVMAVILLFRKPRTAYRQPFSAENIGKCKDKAMASFGRDCSVIRSYTENSLTSQPRIALEHVNRAESIIKKALDFSR